MSLKACSASVGSDGAGCAAAGGASLVVSAAGVSPAAASGGVRSAGGALLASVVGGGTWSGGVAGVSLPALAGPGGVPALAATASTCSALSAAGSAVCANAAAGTSSVARARWSPFERIGAAVGGAGERQTRYRKGAARCSGRKGKIVLQAIRTAQLGQSCRAAVDPYAVAGHCREFSQQGQARAVDQGHRRQVEAAYAGELPGHLRPQQ